MKKINILNQYCNSLKDENYIFLPNNKFKSEILNLSSKLSHEEGFIIRKRIILSLKRNLKEKQSICNKELKDKQKLFGHALDLELIKEKIDIL